LLGTIGGGGIVAVNDREVPRGSILNASGLVKNRFLFPVGVFSSAINVFGVPLLVSGFKNPDNLDGFCICVQACASAFLTGKISAAATNVATNRLFG